MGILEALRKILPQAQATRASESSRVTAPLSSSASYTSNAPDSSPPTSAHPSWEEDTVGRTVAPTGPSVHPDTSSPAIDPRAIALDWISCLSTALSMADTDSLSALFAPVAVLRDSLVFTWDLRAPAGPAAIAAHMCTKGGSSRGDVREFALDERPGLAPVILQVDQPGAISLAFTFVTPLGKGWGSARLFPRRHYGDDRQDGWVADSAFVMLDSFAGHDKPDLKIRPDPDIGHGIPWETSEAQRKKKIEDEPYVLIVGAGQTGLMLAARFQQLGLPTLIIEKDARVGDEWRRRYRTLALHTVKEHHTLLFSPYPDTWPTYTPKDKLADWFEGYAKAHDLVLWTSAPLLSDPRPVYSETDKFWTAHIGQPGGGIRTVRCRHIVLATGALGPPVIPVVPGSDSFRGEIFHASKFYSGADYAGRRVLVVGAANTAADICQDLVTSGAAQVTMLQRSSSCVVLKAALAASFAQMFPIGEDLTLCDYRIGSIPWRVRERLILQEREERLARGEDPDVEPEDMEQMRKIKETGFLVNNGRGGRGLAFILLERFGGHLIDVGFFDLLFRGEINLKAGTELSKFTESCAHFADGTCLDVDVIIYATGYQPGTVGWTSMFGRDVIERAGPMWGLDDEGELRGAYRPSGHPALWYAGGDFQITRWGSKQLGLLLLARRLGYTAEHTTV